MRIYRYPFTLSQGLGLVWTVLLATVVGVSEFSAGRSTGSMGGDILLMSFPMVCLILGFGVFRTARKLAFISLFTATCLAAAGFLSQAGEGRDFLLAFAAAILFATAPIVLTRAILAARRPPPFMS